jgi:hypothetical protein
MTDGQPRQPRTAGREEALRLLGSVPYGRIVFTERALPAVRLANHVMDGGDVVLRVHCGTPIGQVVAYAADLVSAGGLLEWSVVVTGVAREEKRAEEIARYERLLHPMADLPMGHVLRIRPKLVSAQTLADELPAIA